jgi:hypothetical protein
LLLQTIILKLLLSFIKDIFITYSKKLTFNVEKKEFKKNSNYYLKLSTKLSEPKKKQQTFKEFFIFSTYKTLNYKENVKINYIL